MFGWRINSHRGSYIDQKAKKVWVSVSVRVSLHEEFLSNRLTVKFFEMRCQNHLCLTGKSFVAVIFLGNLFIYYYYFSITPKVRQVTNNVRLCLCGCLLTWVPAPMQAVWIHACLFLKPRCSFSWQHGCPHIKMRNGSTFFLCNVKEDRDAFVFFIERILA